MIVTLYLCTARLPATMEEAVSRVSPSCSLSSPQGRVLSSLLSSPLTCLSALARSALPPQPHLTVHLVGSRKIETSCLSAWSVLFSLNPRPASITLVFIGLEVLTPPDPSASLPDNIKCVFQPPSTYEEFAMSESFTEPSIVCAFNCGFILYSSWTASLPHMVRQTGAPLVFTEYYSQDCRANLALVQETVPVTVLQVSPLSTVRHLHQDNIEIAKLFVVQN